MKLFVVILQFADGLLTNTIEAEEPRAAMAEAIRMAVIRGSAKWPLEDARAVLVESPPAHTPIAKPVSVVSVRGMIAALADYSRKLPKAQDHDERNVIRAELVAWFHRHDMTISFAGERDFEDARE